MPTDDLQRALNQIAGKLPQYRLYEQYYDGVQRLAFATNKFRTVFGDLFHEFADNKCATVVDTLADRLQIGGFTGARGAGGLPIGDIEQARLADTIDSIWRFNRMDKGAGQVHVEALKVGDSYLVVWPDAEGRPVLYPNKARQMTLAYDQEEPGRIAWAAKLWPQEDRAWRLNMYYRDRIEKFAIPPPKSTRADAGRALPEKARAFMPYEVEGEPWPLPNPYGVVPVAHFPNNAGVGEFGRSELRDVLPLQDLLNKAMADQAVAMEREAMPQRWATGIEIPTDPLTGAQITPFKHGAGEVWWVSVADAAFGQFPQANMDGFLATQESLRKEIASISRTPLHYVMELAGTYPSGESLKVAEAPLHAKVRDRQLSYGNSWENAVGLALRMVGLDAPMLDTVWTDTGPRDEQARATIVQTLTGAGASLEGAAEVAGYTTEEAQALAEVDLALVAP